MPEDDETEISWHEQELFDAMRRLAQARGQIAQLEQQAAAVGPVIDADVVARAEAIDAEMAELADKASHRFGGGAARSRIDELTAELDELLAGVGAADIEALRHRAADRAEAVDATMLEFARAELASAEAAFAELRQLDFPDPDPEPTSDADSPSESDQADDEDLATVTEIDERLRKQAAS